LLKRDAVPAAFPITKFHNATKYVLLKQQRPIALLEHRISSFPTPHNAGGEYQRCLCPNSYTAGRCYSRKLYAIYAGAVRTAYAVRCCFSRKVYGIYAVWCFFWRERSDQYCWDIRLNPTIISLMYRGKCTVSNLCGAVFGGNDPFQCCADIRLNPKIISLVLCGAVFGLNDPFQCYGDIRLKPKIISLILLLFLVRM
jgi:hypothetical protein